MIEELKVAADLVMKRVHRNLIQKRSLYQSGLNDSDFFNFCLALFRAMLFEFSPIWNTNEPTKHMDEREIRLWGDVNHSQHKCIEMALEMCKFTHQQLRLHELPLNVIINPGMVCVEGEIVYFRTKINQIESHKGADQPTNEEHLVVLVEPKTNIKMIREHFGEHCLVSLNKTYFK